MPRINIALVLSGLMASSLLAGCSTSNVNPNLPQGSAAYDTIPATIPVPTAYSIRPKDILTLRVFGEPDLSQDDLRVDDVGVIQVPLVGPLLAKGRSSDEISHQIRDSLAKRYLVDPKVSLSVKEAAPSYVSVEGEVEKPGVYQMQGRTTLLAALAQAESPTLTAKLDEVVIFRTIDDKPMAARFNLKDIRVGNSPDPMIVDGDVVMVGFSRSKGLWQDVLKTAPFFNAFAVLSTR